jgi:2-polyprenyl-6-methoxyphenol hydroxylase-like FAD-dependent oxidoreductase
LTPHAVISGAGIGGPALAHQLASRGWKTTVIERFPQRRNEGPRTRTGIRALHAGARLVSSPVGKALGAVTGNRMNAAEQLPLPDYSHRTGTAT